MIAKYIKKYAAAITISLLAVITMLVVDAPWLKVLFAIMMFGAWVVNSAVVLGR